MIVFNTTKALQSALQPLRAEGKTIGLVPTMGALHAGHASLVRRSVEENDCTVVSVFVNPTQFNDPTDLQNYPRTLEADCRLLESLHADFVFAPTVEEAYPEPDTRQFSYPPVDTVMEGARRPGDLQTGKAAVSLDQEIVEHQVDEISGRVGHQRDQLEIHGRRQGSDRQYGLCDPSGGRFRKNG